MSDHGHAAAADAHAEPGDGHDHHYLGVAADRAGPDEPITPGWLTLTGIGLVLATILGFVVTRPDAKTRAELTQAAAPAETAAAEAAPAPAPPSSGPRDRRPLRAAPSALRPGMDPSAIPSPPGSGSPRRLPGQFAIPGGPERQPRRPQPGHEGHGHD